METIVQALSLNLRTIVTKPSEQNDVGPDLSNTPSRSDDVLFCTDTRIAPPGADIGLSSKPLVTGTTLPGTYARANISETEEESALISKNPHSQRQKEELHFLATTQIPHHRIYLLGSPPLSQTLGMHPLRKMKGPQG